MSTELAIKVSNESVMTCSDVCEQVNLVQQVMSVIMKRGCHYDVVPGCGDKPTLLKPGAEKLAMTFRLDLQADTEIIDLGNRHREYRTKTLAYHIKTGERLGSGMGSCSTLETKFRYRNENTGREVPAQYWKTRDQNLLGGSSFTTRKVDGKWYIFQQVEHPNPADYYNTCLKMSEKRSKVAAILNVTAASDIFTQDIEDIDIVDIDKETGEIKEPGGKPKVNPPQSKSENQSTDTTPTPPDANLITEAQAKRFYAIAKNVGWEDSELKAWMLSIYKIDSTKKITKGMYEEICEQVKVFPPRPKTEERIPGIEG